jgi:hypothetical protein
MFISTSSGDCPPMSTTDTDDIRPLPPGEHGAARCDLRLLRVHPALRSVAANDLGGNMRRTSTALLAAATAGWA